MRLRRRRRTLSTALSIATSTATPGSLEARFTRVSASVAPTRTAMVQAVAERTTGLEDRALRQRDTGWLGHGRARDARSPRVLARRGRGRPCGRCRTSADGARWQWAA